MKNMCQLMLLLASGWMLSGCGLFGKKEKSPFDPEKIAAQTAQEKIDKERKEEIAREHNRPPKKEEFLLTLVADDPSVAQLDSVEVDVISVAAEELAQLLAQGPVGYRDSRKTGAVVKSHTFKKGGRFEVRVPSIPATDTVVLWAELAAPAKGSDTRMLQVPLKLDKSDPTKVPVANPITVNLTASGWQRVN